MQDNIFADLLKEKKQDFISEIGRIKQLGNISVLKEPYSRNITFPILNMGDKEFYEKEFYNRYIEHFLRTNLINPVLIKLFIDKQFDVLVPTDKRVFVPPHNTRDHENFTGNVFEFIVKNQTAKFGIRYSDIYEDEINDLYDKFCGENSEEHLDYFAIIHWFDENSKDAEIYKKIRNKNDGIVRYFAIEEFFKIYFPPSHYNLFMTCLNDALDEADEIIGLNTIAQYKNENINDVRVRIENELRSISYAEFDYQPIEPTKSNIQLDSQDFTRIYTPFLSQKLYRILTGTSNAAKSFMTSEYLLKVFDGRGAFDFTSIVAGYFKSVELLLYDVALTHIDEPNVMIKKKDSVYNPVAGEKCIRVNNKKPVYYIPFTSTNRVEDYFDTTLGPLKYFFKSNKRLLDISKDGKDTFIKALTLYTLECRNGNFHKHIISDWDIVKKIRNNTIFILTILLGGSAKSISNHLDSFEVLDTTFEDLYKNIMNAYSGANKYIFEYADGSEHKVMKLHHQENVKFDQYGMLENTKIVFAVVSDYSSKEWERINTNDKALNLLYLSKNSMPRHIWRIVKGQKVKII